MRVSRSLFLALCLFQATAAWAAPWVEPGEILGFSWGAPVDAVRQELPGGQFRRETPFTSIYAAGTTLHGIPVSAAFQFASEQGLQGVMVRFPVHRLAEIVAVFEREYGRAPIRGNREWRWEGSSVRISLGEYPSLRSGGRRGVAWLRTRALEAAIARGDEARRSLSEETASEHGSRARPQMSRPEYEERLLRKIYWALRYPATSPGVYLVSVAFQLTQAGRAAALELAVDPPNPDVTDSVKAAISRAQPFPPPPPGIRGDRDPRITLELTVTIFP